MLLLAQALGSVYLSLVLTRVFALQVMSSPPREVS